LADDHALWCCLQFSNYAMNGDEEACEVLIALVGVPVIGLCYSALGETSDLAQDRAACVQAVQQPPPSGTTDQQQFEACMNAHGWKLLQ
jgi:hypothetical protein